MSDLTKYAQARAARDPELADGLETGYTDFKVGALLRQAREKAGLTQEQVAERLSTKKSAISRIENSAGSKGLFVAGVKLPLALAELGLIDEYELVVQPRLAGHGPTLFAGLSKPVDLKLVSRLEFGSGAVAMRYEPRR
jgi:DNA-binding XRE family transcriptional regulator